MNTRIRNSVILFVLLLIIVSLSTVIYLQNQDIVRLNQENQELQKENERYILVLETARETIRKQQLLLKLNAEKLKSPF